MNTTDRILQHSRLLTLHLTEKDPEKSYIYWCQAVAIEDYFRNTRDLAAHHALDKLSNASDKYTGQWSPRKYS